MKFTFRDIVWIVIITIIVMLLSKCHRDDKGELEEKIKSVQARHRNDSLAYLTAIAVQEHTVQVSVKQADSLQTINRTLETKLDGTAATVVKLSKALQSAKLPGINAQLITVDQDYVSYCDSLAFQSTNLAFEYFNYKKNNNSLIEKKDEIIKGKDNIIATERQAKDNCLRDYDALTHYYQKAAKTTNQVFIGVELIGNPTYLVNNAGLAITLKTKTNKLWQVSGGLQTNGQYYARINGNILIRLKH